MSIRQILKECNEACYGLLHDYRKELEDALNKTEYKEVLAVSMKFDIKPLGGGRNEVITHISFVSERIKDKTRRLVDEDQPELPFAGGSLPLLDREWILDCNRWWFGGDLHYVFHGNKVVVQQTGEVVGRWR